MDSPKEKSNLLERTLLIEGRRLQQSGFRDQVARVAYDLGITGKGTNLKEEKKVEIICEGSQKELDKFEGGIRKVGYPSRVVDISKTEEREVSTRSFGDFEIERSEVERDNDVLPAKADTFMTYQRETVGKIEGLRGETDTNFKNMETRYGAIHRDLHALVNLLAIFGKNYAKTPGDKEEVEKIKKGLTGAEKER